MVTRILILFLGGYWFISAGVAAWIGRQKGRMLEGLGLGILMGPIGPIIVALLPDLRKTAEPAAHHARPEVEPETHPEHEAGHATHAVETIESHVPPPAPPMRMAAVRREASDDWEAFEREAAIDRLEEEDDLWERGAPKIEKRLRVDWLWLVFYGGGTLFVVFCWLWLLLYV